MGGGVERATILLQPPNPLTPTLSPPGRGSLRRLAECRPTPPSSRSKVSPSAMARAPALDGVSLAVPAGQFVALVGPSGSGKTTLLKSINRLVEPDEGGVRIDGRDVRDDAAAGAPPRHRLCDPEHRPVPAHDGRREYRHRAAADRVDRARAGPRSCSSSSRCPPRWPAAIRASFPAASSSASASPARWRRGRS